MHDASLDIRSSVALFFCVQIRNVRLRPNSFFVLTIMIVALPVLSFLCFTLLSLCLLGPNVRSDIPQLSLVIWLIIGNLIHGINSLVWSGNTDIHIPAWCDIVTKVMLAVAFALPACCLCMAANLELVASKRPYVVTAPARRARLILNVIICWVSPLIYCLLHFIVQHHRFDIIRDFGCTAAFHNSAASFLVVWLPPFLLCVASFIFGAMALHHSFNLTVARFDEHIFNRLDISSSAFMRRVANVFILTLSVSTFSVFILFTRSDFRSFANWSALHEHFRKIFVLGPTPDLNLAKMSWWLIPAVSLAYLVMWVLVGQDLRDLVRGYYEGNIRFPTLPRPKFPQIKVKSIIPTHFGKGGARSPKHSRPKLVAPVLVSGWDEMLDTRCSRYGESTVSDSPTPSRSPSQTKSCASTKGLSITTDFERTENRVLGTPTKEYANPEASSPVLQSPPPAYKHSLDADPFLPSDPFSKTLLTLNTVPDDVSSISDIPWPAPPSTVPNVKPILPKRPPRPQSLAVSDLSFSGSLSRPPTPPSLRAPPFRGPSVTPVPEDISDDDLLDVVRKYSYRTKNERLQRTLGLPSDDKIKRKTSADVIYMTMVTYETS